MSIVDFVQAPLNALFLMGCFRGNFLGRELRQYGKRPIKEGKRPIIANEQFLGTPPPMVENGPSEKAHYPKDPVILKILRS